MMKISKKIIAALLAVVLIAAAFAGCSSNGAKDDKKDDASVSDTATNVKVGFIFLHDENSTYDKNFMDAAKAACEKKGIEPILKTNIPEGQECKDAADDLVDQGCNVIFADSFGHEPYMAEAAKAHPDVQFCHATGTTAHTAGIANFHNAFASIYEGRYLAGIAAGMKLNEMIEAGQFKESEAKIGYVGAYPYAEVVSGYTSFFLGARSVCPSATMEVTYTGSWYDETKEKEAATKLIGRDCKLISQHADSLGAPSACENAGVPNVSYNGSTVDSCPNTFIVSSRINWEPYFEYMLDCVANNKAIDVDWTGTIATGSVVLTEVNEKAAAKGTQAAIDEAKAKLEDGSLKVFDTKAFTVGGKELTEYKADVDTDENFTPDTEVIENGCFNESTKRSAPYFDVRIDGITELDKV